MSSILSENGEKPPVLKKKTPEEAREKNNIKKKERGKEGTINGCLCPPGEKERRWGGY